ncbi:MAG: hypothetical protein U0794_06505 [Isosphaeraceae bacterium]
MIDQVMEQFRRATESTLQIQQQLLQQWSQQWTHLPFPGFTGMPGMPGMPAGMTPPAFGTPMADQVQVFQKRMAAAVTDLLEKHRAALDAQYAAGIRTLEDAFRIGEAKDPAQLLRLTEEFWKHSFDCLKTLAEDQVKGFQAATQTWMENVSKGTP